MSASVTKATATNAVSKLAAATSKGIRDSRVPVGFAEYLATRAAARLCLKSMPTWNKHGLLLSKLAPSYARAATAGAADNNSAATGANKHSEMHVPAAVYAQSDELNDKISFTRANIVTLDIDAIVNAANSGMLTLSKRLISHEYCNR